MKEKSAMVMKTPKNHILDYTIFTLLLLGLIYIISIPSHTDVTTLAQQLSHRKPNLKVFKMMVYRDELDEALAKVSTKKKTIIIAVVNKAYVEGDKPMLDLFLDGFWAGENTRPLIDNLLIVAVDQTSYDRCMFLRLHCYKLKTHGVDFGGKEVLYMSDDFIKMMWRRTLFLGEVLKRGYNFIFTDTDILWLRSPFAKLNFTDDVDFQISTDSFNGKEWSQDNRINTGFYMVKSNKKTIAIFDQWYAMKNNSKGLKEQDVLENMKKGGMFKKFGLKVKFLDTVEFSGFCQDSNDVQRVTTVHANCCRTISAKLVDLTTVLHDWNKFKTNITTNGSYVWSYHIACGNSWHS